MSSFINIFVSAISVVVPKKRLLGPLIVAVFCIVALGVMGFYFGHEVGNQSESISRKRQMTTNIIQLDNMIKIMNLMERGYLETENRDFIRELRLTEETIQIIPKTKLLFASEQIGTRKVFDDLALKVGNRFLNIKRNIEYAETMGRASAKRLAKEEVNDQLSAEISDLAKQLTSKLINIIEIETRQREKELAKLIAILLIGTTGGFIILFASYASSRKQISQLSEAEQKAKNALNALQNIVDTVPDPVLILEADLRVIGAGRSFYEFFELDRFKTEGKLIYEIGNREWDIPQFRQLLGAVLSTRGKAADFEVTNSFPKIGERTWLISARKMSSEIAGLPRILVSLKDITPRKIAENRMNEAIRDLQALREALEVKVAERTRELTNKEEFLNRAVAVANLGIFDHNLSNDDVLFSGQMRQICGFNSDDSIAFPDWVKRLHPEDRDEVIARILKGQDPRGTGLISLEHRIIVPGGAVRWVSTKALTFFEEKANQKFPVRTIGVTLDITERKKTEKLVQETLNSLALKTSKLEESNKSLERFAAVAAHDLRAPIRSIGLWVELLENYIAKPWSEELINAIQFLKLNAHKSGDLIDDLLEIAKIKHLPTKMERVDLNQVTNQILASLQGEIEKQNAKISVSSLPIILGSAMQWESVFGNLIRNAMLYHKKSLPPEISIWTEETEENIKLFVQDKGIGIAPQYQQKIFEMFERLHTDMEYPGTGIGLALCKKIVESWGGTISVISEPGKGSTFCVSYPRKSNISERRIA